MVYGTTDDHNNAAESEMIEYYLPVEIDAEYENNNVAAARISYSFTCLLIESNLDIGFIGVLKH